MKYILFILVVVAPNALLAQEPSRQVIRYQHNFSLIVGGPMVASKNEIPCAMGALQYERRIQSFSVGIRLSVGEFDGYHEEHILNVYNTTLKAGTAYLLSLIGNYYFFQYKRFDAYGGASLSYFGVDDDLYLHTQRIDEPYKTGSVGRTEAHTSSGAKAGVQIGGHFWIRPRFGIVAEFGYGKPLVNAGVVLRK